MKVAVFITGHFRDAPKTHENYKQFLESNHDVDFYIGSWSNYDVHRESRNIIPDKIDVESISKKLFGERLKGVWSGDVQKYEMGESPYPNSPPKIVWEKYASVELLNAVKNSPEFKPGDYPNINYYFYWMQRLLDQYYVMREIYRLSDNFNSYDVCLRIRGDMSFINKPNIPIEELADGIHVNGYAWLQTGTHDYTQIQPWGISDQIAWGKPTWMKKYFEYANHYCDLFSKLATPESCSPRFNGTIYPPHIQNTFYLDSGHMLAYYLLKYPYFRELNPNDPNDCDLMIHRHGHPHQDVKTPTGVVLSYDYYNIISKWRYGD